MDHHADTETPGPPPSFLNAAVAYIWFANLPGLTGIPFVPAHVAIGYFTTPPPAELVSLGFTYQETREGTILGVPPNDFHALDKAWERFAHWQAHIGLLVDSFVGVP